MVAINVVQRLRQNYDLRAYRRKVAAELNQTLALRLLPALLDLPLEYADPTGKHGRLDDVLARTARLTLAGPYGSGRGLTLRQLAHRWSTADSPVPVPLLINLAQLDDQRTPPASLIADLLARLSQPISARSMRVLSRAPLVPAPPDDLAGWGLLVEGWEGLPPARQAAWRDTLLDAPHLWPEAHVVVALPRSERPWQGFTRLTLAPPSPMLLVQWVTHLGVASQRATLLEALSPGGGLAPLAERLAEVALLAWVAPRTGLPAGRADLYTRALTDLIGLTPLQRPSDLLLNDLQLLAAYDEAPPVLVPGLVEQTTGGTYRFAHPLIHHYLAARQLVAEERFELLHGLAPRERREVVRFAATLLERPEPVYAALWGQGRQAATDLLILGDSLRDQPSTPPLWTLRTVGALALLARDGTPEQRGPALALLPQLMPALDLTLDGLDQHNPQQQTVIARLLRLLPTNLMLPRAQQLVYDDAADEGLAWNVADLLIEQPAGALDLAEQPTGRLALARWAYVQALAGPHSRAHLLQHGDTGPLAALQESAGGSARLLQVAAVLVEDPDIPARARIAGMALLAGNNQPTAMTVIERACYDQNADVRRAALDALVRRDPARAYTPLSRTALDQQVPWDTRLGAILHLGNCIAQGAGPLLARCAADATLPLFARLTAVAAIGAAGQNELLDELLRDSRSHPQVRAMAARRLTSGSHPQAPDYMLALVSDPGTPTDLAAALCEGLGQLGDVGALPTLLRLLARSAADPELTLACIAGLGELHSEDAVPALSDLLGGGALSRLRSAVPEIDPQEPSTSLLARGALAPALAERLTLALSEAINQADRPTALAEFFSHEADRLRRAAATALLTIGGNTARAALLSALLDGETGNATAALIDALAHISGPDPLESLGYLLSTAEVDPLTRWLVVQALRDHPDGEPIMRRTLAQPELDPFTRGALAEALGERRASTALPLLRQLADDPHGESHLRTQAVLGLGLLDEPEAEVVLIRLISATSESDELRGLAAAHLPSQLSAEGRRFLRDMLRRERPAPPIGAGALRALGHAHDREALPLMLRYAQDDPPQVAQAALLALCDMGDTSVAPVLVRVVQNPNADQATRLRAVGTLLRLGGQGYRPLLQAYLEQGPLPLRMQALDHLLAANPTSSELVALLADRSWPNPLRLRLLNHCAALPEARPALMAIAQSDDDDGQLRSLAIIALGQHHGAQAAQVLLPLAENPATDLRLRLRAIDALGTLDSMHGWLALSRLADQPNEPAIVRRRATLALYQAAGRTPANIPTLQVAAE